MSISVKNFGDYSVKAIKSFQGREGYGFNANLYRGKKKVAFAMDSANGGEIDIDWVGDRKAIESEMKLLQAHLATLPPVKSEYASVGELTIDASWFVTDCVTKWERDRDMRKMVKQCKTKTLYRTLDHKFGQYAIMASPCHDGTRLMLKRAYGEDVEIFNDVIAEGKLPSVMG